MRTPIHAAALAAAALTLSPTLAAGQQVVEQPRTVTVSATATVERAPDQAVLNVAVVTEGSTAAEASAANADRMAAVVARLRQLGLEDRHIRTSGYNLNPRYRSVPRDTMPPTIVGYTATNNVTVTVDSVGRVGPVIDAVVRDGANRINGISFQIADPMPLHMEAVRRAAEMARVEARVLAEAVGNRLGEAMSIHTSGFMPPQPPRPMYDMAMMRMEVAQAAPTPIEAGEMSVSASVTITFELVGGGAP